MSTTAAQFADVIRDATLAFLFPDRVITTQENLTHAEQEL